MLSNAEAEDHPAGHIQPRSRSATLMLYAVLLVASAIALVPAYFMVISSVKTKDAYLADRVGFPSQIVPDSYNEVLANHPFFLWMGNSALISIGSVLVSTMIAATGAFAIARMQFRGREALLAISTSLMAVPPVVMVVPLFVLFSQIGLLGTYPGVILIYSGLLTPFSVYLLVTFFRTIPMELLEAALIDGASTIEVLWRVVLPLSGAPLVTLFIVNLLYVWNDLLIALLFLPDERLRTLMVGVSVFQGRYLQNIPLSMAGMAMASAPMLVVYILFQRYFIRGLVAGAVKG
jgi:ABC-type glycerol-3-phosphate transport system permease component